MTKINKDKNLTWVYPLNNHVTEYGQTFVYGYSNPKAEIFCQVEAYPAKSEARQGRHGMHYESNKARKTKIKIFPNGNFAQVVKLPFKRNVIRMVQILNGKKKTIIRQITVRSVGAEFILPVHSKNKKDFINSPLPSPFSPLCLVVDPGHGGKEHGTHSPKGIPEKIYNLQISKMLVKMLCATSLRRAKIYLTRSSDKFVSLDERINFAKKKKCNLFISIHHNALPDNENPLKHRGIGIYYTHESVKPLAKKFLENICKKTGLKKYGLFKRNFRVTKQDSYTGILIECGFLIHPIESEIITNKKMQEKIVQGIISSIW